MHHRMNFRLMIWAACLNLTLFVAGLHGQADKMNAGSPNGSALSQQTTENPNGSALSQKIANLTGTFLEGTKISAEEASELEDIVAKNPDNLEAQGRLLSYYYTHEAKDKNLRPKHEQRVLWLIQNHPEAAFLNQPHGLLLPRIHNYYAEGERLWNNQLQKYPDNLKVISNACSYFEVGDIDRAIQCYKSGKSLDSGNASEWDCKLGNSYNSKMANSPAEEKALWAKEALSAFESAYTESQPKTFSYNSGGSTRTFAFPDLTKGIILLSITKAALAAGDLDKASKYANQMLETSGERENSLYKGDYIYQGNSTLGLVAVHKGDLDSAEKYLLKAGETPGSAGLKMDPEMSLAKDLLSHGRRDAVLAFLKECQRFSTSSFSHVSQWIQEMEEGKTPDFDQFRHELEQRIQEL